MDEDAVEVESDAVEITEQISEAVEVIAEERRRSAVWRHPDHLTIEHLIRAGRSAVWIAMWLQDQYPVPEDEADEEDFGWTAAQAETWRLTSKTIKDYQQRWMPECDPKVDVVNEDLEDLIGRKMPARPGQLMEVDILEMGLHVTQHLVAKSIESDQRLKMVTPTTLDATSQMVSTAERLALLKAKLRVPGYQLAAERQEIKTDNRNTTRTELSANVNLTGRESDDAGRGPQPVEPSKVKTLLGMLELPADERRALLAATAAPEGEVEKQEEIYADFPADSPEHAGTDA